MNRPVLRWIVFGLCLSVLVGALGWITHRTLRIEEQQKRSAAETKLRERVRQALWRMEAEASAIVVRESARPAQHYQAFPPIEEMLADTGAVEATGEIRQPSPLLGTTPELVRLHFQCAPVALPDVICSPQVPEGEDRDLALERYAVAPEVAAAEKRMADLKRLLQENPAWEKIAGFPRAQVTGKSGVAQFRRDDGTLVAVTQQDTWADVDQTWRNDMLVKKPIEQSLIAEQAPPKKADTPPASARVISGMKTVWLGDELVLVRQVLAPSGPQLQGVWLDWPALRDRLLATVTDLLPEAKLQAIREGEPRDDWRALVALPVRLDPGPLAGLNPPTSGLRAALSIAWICLIGASVAIGFVLHRALQLSERRAAFVSAVTHELRTPLTTFRLYSEMLAENAVAEESQRRSYLKTLCEESDRLMRLVENVLAFSRIERDKAPPPSESLTLDDLLDRCLPRLNDRCEQAGLTLEIENKTASGASHLQTSPAVIEQILFNLVDNAAKYAGSKTSRSELKISVETSPQKFHITVRDFGPGLSHAGARRLFRPFRKSAHDAAESAPGVGLGLALSRRLARQLGGDLMFQRPESGPGAAFILVLPR